MVSPALATLAAILVPLLLAAAAAAQAARRTPLAHVARAAALVAAAVTAAGVEPGAALAVRLFDGLHLDGLPAGVHLTVALRGDGPAAAALALLAALAFLAPWVVPAAASHTRAAAAADLAACGAAVIVLAEGWLALLIGYELCAAGIGLAGVAQTASAATGRRVLAVLRLGAAGLAAAVVLAPVSWPGDAILSLPAVIVLAGVWPAHVLTVRPVAGGALLRQAPALAALHLFGRLQPALDPGPVLGAGLVTVALVAVAGALAAPKLVRSLAFTVGAQMAAVLLVATVAPTAALLLLAAHLAAQLALQGGLEALRRSLPKASATFAETGGLAASLPWSRWLCVAAAATAVFAVPVVWGQAVLVADLLPAAAPLAVGVALVLAAPGLPLLRLALAPFGGAPRTAGPAPTRAVSLPARSAAVAALVIAFAGLPLAAWRYVAAPSVPAAGIALGADVVVTVAGLLLWRRGPRAAAATLPWPVSLAASGFGVARGLDAAGHALTATARGLWTTVDTAVVGAGWAAVDAAGRGGGWLLARLHAGWTGWTVAAALGTGALVLWARFGS